MMYECTLENAEGTMVLAWYKADSAEAFRIADAFSAARNEPLAMLAVCHTENGQYPAAWIVGKPDEDTEIRLNTRRARFLTCVNDIFEKYGRQPSQ